MKGKSSPIVSGYKYLTPTNETRGGRTGNAIITSMWTGHEKTPVTVISS
jgi:hypothetical protein